MKGYITLKLKKILAVVTCFFLFSSSGFAMPANLGRARIAPTPERAPDFIPKPFDSLSPLRNRPVPTNQWFRSFIRNQWNNPALRLYTFPKTLKPSMVWPANLESTGLVICFPDNVASVDPHFDPGLAGVMINSVGFGYRENTDQRWDLAMVEGIINGLPGPSPTVITAGATNTLLFDYSDWSATALWRDQNDPARYMKATMGRGFVFTYFEFSSGVDALVRAYHIPNRTWTAQVQPDGEGIVITVTRTVGGDPTVSKYLGVFVPPGSTIISPTPGVWGSNNFRVVFPDDANRYMSVAVLTDPSDYAQFRRYAYNFITSTRAEKSVDIHRAEVSTRFNFEVNRRRTGAEFSQVPLFTIWPHHFNSDRITFEAQEFLSGPERVFSTIRGNIRAVAARSFTTVNYFHGILPKLTDETPGNDVLAYLYDFNLNDPNVFIPSHLPYNPYHAGKVMSMAANLLPIMHTRNTRRRNMVIERLRERLEDWFIFGRGHHRRFFGYESIWGGVLASGDWQFYSHNYNDLHFHYGYFIYAAALLAMYYRNFAAPSQFRNMVDLLVLNIANPFRRGEGGAPANARWFPYLRHFDIYGGHSWASGFGGGNDNDRGPNQESSSEAMNAWAAIYLWGLATGNQRFIELGMWGYVTEYTAIREYWFNQNQNMLGGLYTYPTVATLWGGRIDDNIFWNPGQQQRRRARRGIQVLPLTPSMLYLGFDTSFAQLLHEYDEPPAPFSFWWDIWARFRALYNPAQALVDFQTFRDNVAAVDEGGSRAFTFQFIHFFNRFGTVSTNYFADFPSFGVFENSGATTFMAYNPARYYRRVTFFSRLSGNEMGHMIVPPNTIMFTTDNFYTFNFETSEVMYAHASTGTTDPAWHAFLDTYYLNHVTTQINTDFAPVAPSPFHQMLPPQFQITGVLRDHPHGLLHIDYSNLFSPASGSPMPAGYSASNLTILRFTGTRWEQIYTRVHAATKTVSAEIYGNGIFALALRSNDPVPVDEVFRVFPNPFRPRSGGRFGAQGITFSGIGRGARIRVYTITGALVFEGRKTDDITRTFVWNGQNNSGRSVASGIYIYHVEYGGRRHRGRLAIER
ncbi:MAG: glycosyl hydrolase [Elusimicrobia bacterium]|nr:glycosyl hydrolase [Elusimicrobiota bacterium]